MEIDEKPVKGMGILLLLVTLGMVMMTGLQAVALFGQGNGLSTTQASQTETINQSVKIRAQLDALAGKTAKLADHGNADAKTIIDDLRRQGITVKPAP